MKTRTIVAILAALLLFAAARADVTKDVTFPPGENTVEYKGSVPVGKVDRYYLKVTAGQRMSVLLESPKDNASFIVLTPKGKLFSPRHQRKFNGTLPSSGRYLIEVKSSGPNTTYSLTVNTH